MRRLLALGIASMVAVGGIGVLAGPAAGETSGECSVPEGADLWHAPTDHEHGDPPPDWANAWSCEQFGHPVIFGGDESTPGENVYKHNAFKGYSFWTVADNRQEIQLYVRIHMQTNPHGREARWHSYEMYAARDGAVLGFWQGWLDFGASPDHRNSYGDDYLWKIIPNFDPANHIVGFDPESNPYYVESYAGREFWYSQKATPGGWDPVIIVDIYDPSTYYSAGEQAQAMDPATWQPTGDFGLDRQINLRWIAEGATTVTVSGQPYLTRNMENPRGWFCATPRGVITSSGWRSCEEGSLPQFISPAMPTIGDLTPISRYRKVWPCPDCRLPN